MNNLYKWATGLMGLWLIASAFLTFSEEVMTANLMIVGFLVAAIGFIGLVGTERDAKSHYA